MSMRLMSPSARYGNMFVGAGASVGRRRGVRAAGSAAGVEGEVDWGEAQVWMAASARRVYLFHMRACHSGAAFAMAFPHCSQQAFWRLMCRRLTGSAGCSAWCATTIWRARSSRCSAAASAWRPTGSSRCARTISTSRSSRSRGSRGPRKGRRGGRGGAFPSSSSGAGPRVASLGELNARLLAGCEADLHRRIAGRQETVGEAFARERPLLRGLPAERASTAEQATPRVNAKALVTIKQNRYSVPCAWPGCASMPGWALARSSCVTAASWSLSMSVCRAASACRPHWTTIWSCSLASRVRWPGRSLSPRSASAAPGHPSSMSCGGRSPSATGPRRPPGRWSTC